MRYPENKKRKRFYRRGRKLFFLLWGIEFSVFAPIAWIFGTGIAVATLYDYHPFKKDVSVPKIQNELVVDRSPISQWSKTPTEGVNDIVNFDGHLSLSPQSYKRKGNTQDPQGYIQPPTTISDNSFICIRIQARTKTINASARLNNQFQVITGDGDNRSIGLKIIDWGNPNGKYIRPDSPLDDPHVDHLNRFRLEKDLPGGDNAKQFTECLQVSSPKNSFSKVVRVEYKVFDDAGRIMDLGPTPKWTIEVPNQQNGPTQFSFGLIDAFRKHPIVDILGYCAVEMNDYGDHPSDREREACINP